MFWRASVLPVLCESEALLLRTPEQLVVVPGRLADNRFIRRRFQGVGRSAYRVSPITAAFFSGGVCCFAASAARRASLSSVVCRQVAFLIISDWRFETLCDADAYAAVRYTRRGVLRMRFAAVGGGRACISAWGADLRRVDQRCRTLRLPTSLWNSRVYARGLASTIAQIGGSLPVFGIGCEDSGRLSSRTSACAYFLLVQTGFSVGAIGLRPVVRSCLGERSRR